MTGPAASAAIYSLAEKLGLDIAVNVQTGEHEYLIAEEYPTGEGMWTVHRVPHKQAPLDILRKDA